MAVPEDDLVIVALRDADTAEPEDGRDAEAGLDTAVPALLTDPDERLDVLPMLIPPRMVPPDVCIAVLPVFLVVMLLRSV